MTTFVGFRRQEWKRSARRAICACALLLFGISPAARADAWEKKIEAESGSYLVKVIPGKIEVARVQSGPDAPPYMRMRVLRPNDRPLELRLHTINKPDLPTTYTGNTDRLGSSSVGFELEVSFDQKTWKKIGSVFKNALP